MMTKKQQGKIDKKLTNIFKSVKFWGIFVSILVGLGAFIFVAMRFFSWTNEHIVLFRSPILLQSPIVIESKIKVAQKEKDITKVPLLQTEEQTIKSFKHGEVLWKVYQLESQRGKEDYCRNQGKGYGGFGVLDNKREIVCYPTFATAVERAEHWLIEAGIEDDFVNGLCIYNLGGKDAPFTNCRYYQDYLSVDL